MIPEEKAPPPLGPPSYVNWRAYLDQAAPSGAYEIPFYTDTRITGELSGDLGPYHLINTVAMPLRSGRGVAIPAIVLRVEIYHREDPHDFRPMIATDVSQYHGGGLEDEIAALVSLCLGIRVQAGTTERMFYPDQDPRGRPVAHEGRLIPVLQTKAGWQIMPAAVGEHALEDALLIKTLPGLSVGEAITLIRAARSYQSAMWIAEVEPESAWLLFVSAIETAASHWSSVADDSIDVLRRSRPGLAADLARAGGEDLLRRAAEELAPIMGATRKFVQFILKFMPDPPGIRPPSGTQLDWSPPVVERALYIIYNYRSRALHGGIPFPYPMCEPPMKYQESDPPAEIPLGLAMRAMGGTWLHEDTPMLLHTFEYLVRGALLNWWTSLKANAGVPR